MGFLSDFQRKRTDWILQFIDNGSSVLDIGCGDCATILYIKSKRVISDIWGVDASELALEHAKKCGIKVLKMDINSVVALDKLPKVDYVILFEILEHLANPEYILKNIVHHVKKGIFISVPNSGYFAHRLRLCLGSFPLQWRLHPGEHLRFWTYKDLIWWLNQLGFGDCSTVKAYEGIPILNNLWGSLFGMGLIVFIKLDS